MGAALQITDNADAAWCLMVPLRRQMLAALVVPNSAAGLARDLGVPRQKINYHLRELEKAGLVAEAEKRVKGNCVERVMRAMATTYLVNPSTIDVPVSGPAVRDRFSSEYLAAAAAQIVRDLAELRPAAQEAGKKLATLSQFAEVRFANAEERRQFAEELTSAVTKLVEKYHQPAAPGGRPFKLLAAVWPAIRRKE